MGVTGDHFSDPQTVDVEAQHSDSRRRLGTKKRRALITDAQRSPEQNRRSRETRYMILQGIRLPFIALSLAAAFIWGNWTLASIFFLISVPLPWISVMVANGQGEVRDARTKNVYKPAVVREEQRLAAKRRAALENPAAPALPAIIDHDDATPRETTR